MQFRLFHGHQELASTRRTSASQLEEKKQALHRNEAAALPGRRNTWATVCGEMSRHGFHDGAAATDADG